MAAGDARSIRHWPEAALEEKIERHSLRMSNEAKQRTGRRLDYVHMPVVREPDESYFAPLADLDIGDTDVYVGLIHHTDGVTGFVRRVELARRHRADFGISAVCGYGRVVQEELPRILRTHAECADALSRQGRGSFSAVSVNSFAATKPN